jgi:hypothetical protein
VDRRSTAAKQADLNMNAFFLSVFVALVIASAIAKELETITSKVCVGHAAVV